MENDVKALGIRGRKGWESVWERQYSGGENLNLERLNQFKQEAAEPLFRLRESLEQKPATGLSLIHIFLGPFVGLTLGFDAINSERSEGTLNRLVAQPIYRDAVINGKFLAGAAIIFLMVFAMGLIIGAVGLLASGILPSAEEVGRVVVLLVFTWVYICFWLALSIFFSVVCRHAATSAMAVIALWIFFALFMSLVVSILTNLLTPMFQVNTCLLYTSFSF